MERSHITTACYENAIPAFVHGALEQLYGSMYASFAHFEVYGGLNEANTYVATGADGIEDIFLYRREHRSIHVINEQMRLDAQAIDRFANTMFERYPEVDTVSFHAVDADQLAATYPCQRFNCTNDIMMPLPASVQDYYASLGKSTRKTLNQNGNRLQKRYDTYQFQILEAQEVSEAQLKDIIELNRARMEGKSRVSAIDDAEAARIIAFTRQCGLVGLISIDGKIRAGAICYRIGSHYHLRVIGHDPQYNAYGLGMLCCYRTICECIARGGTQFHFMWGQEEYKYRLLGVQQELAHIILYRSRARMLAHADTALRTMLTGWKIQTHMWILERLRHRDHWAIRTLHRAAAWLRNRRRAAGEPLSPDTRATDKSGLLPLSHRK